MDIKFNSVEELYKRLYPALTTKCYELRRLGYSYIKQIHIWDYLREGKWKSSRGLTLSDMVDDVLNCENKKLDQYVKRQLAKEKSEEYEN